MKKYLPIRIHHIFFGYGWWWGEYFYFLGKKSSCFAIVPMYKECKDAIYTNNGKIVGDGDTKSWSDARQMEKNLIRG